MALRENHKTNDLTGDLILTVTPLRDGNITWETCQALRQSNDLPDTKILQISVTGMGIADARNALVSRILDVPNSLLFKPIEFFVLWVDSDAWWPPGSIQKLSDALKTYPQIDLIGGWFSARRPMFNAAAYNNGPITLGLDGEAGDIIECSRLGFHFVMHRFRLLEHLGEKPFGLRNEYGSEDSAFCHRLRGIGGRIFVHTGCPVAHVDAATGLAYLPNEPAFQIGYRGSGESSIRAVPLPPTGSVVRKYQ